MVWKVLLEVLRADCLSWYTWEDRRKHSASFDRVRSPKREGTRREFLVLEQALWRNVQIDCPSRICWTKVSERRESQWSVSEIFPVSIHWLVIVDEIELVTLQEHQSEGWLCQWCCSQSWRVKTGRCLRRSSWLWLVTSFWWSKDSGRSIFDLRCPQTRPCPLLHSWRVRSCFGRLV